MSTNLAMERPPHVSAERFVDFDIYQPMSAGQGFHEAWKQLQDSGVPDVIWTPRNGGHWIALRGKSIDTVLSDFGRFSSHTVLVPKETAGAAYRVVPISLDPPEHKPFRKLLNDDLAPSAIRVIEVQIRELSIQLITALQPRGRCNFVKEFAEQLPLRIFMKMVDLPFDDMPRLKYLVDQFTRPDGTMTYDQVNKALLDYIEPVISRRRGETGTDMISRMVNAKIGDREMTDEEAANLCIQVLVGGLDTVVNFLSFVMIFLAQSPESRRELIDQPILIAPAINELIRRFGLVTVGREVTRDLVFEGASLKNGEMIMIPTLLRGLDERENVDPMAVHFNRTKSKHATFGSGSHTCPGAHLAKAEARIMVEEWLARIPNFDIAADSPPSYTGGIVASVNPFSLTWDADAALAQNYHGEVSVREI